MATKRVQVIVRGRVTGVFFRAATQREARRLGRYRLGEEPPRRQHRGRGRGRGGRHQGDRLLGAPRSVRRPGRRRRRALARVHRRVLRFPHHGVIARARAVRPASPERDLRRGRRPPLRGAGRVRPAAGEGSGRPSRPAASRRASTSSAVASTARATTVEAHDGALRVGTVEHAFAALGGLGRVRGTRPLRRGARDAACSTAARPRGATRSIGSA